MTALLIILLVLALIFGIGAVLEGIFWLLVLAVAAIALLAIVGWFKFRSYSRSGSPTQV